MTDLALVLENLAKTLVPEPYLASVVLGGMSLLEAGDAEQHQKYLTPMIEGRTSLALAYAERGSRHDVLTVTKQAEKSGDGHVLRGEKVWVLNGHAADHWLVSAVGTDGLGLYVVAKGATGVVVESVQTLDGRRAANLHFEGAPAERLRGGAAKDVLLRAMDRAAAAACAEGVGVAQRMLEMTLEYLRTREQFGVKIGTFQALQHRAVDMFVEVELCRSMATLAVGKADDANADERAAAVSAAKAQLSMGGRFVAQQAVQLHGGIGVTDEHDVGLYFKRMYALNLLFGDEEFHVARFASLPSFGKIEGPVLATLRG